MLKNGQPKVASGFLKAIDISQDLDLELHSYYKLLGPPPHRVVRIVVHFCSYDSLNDSEW